jgi:putative flippase GtrA
VSTQTILDRRGLTVFVRYATIGVAQNAFFYALTLLFLTQGWAAWQATVILYPIAVTISFALNRSWSFAAHGRSWSQLRNYAAVYVLAYPITIFLNWVQEHAGVPSWLASLVTLVASAVAIFLALRLWVFRSPGAPR